MTLFWLICAALLIVAILFVAIPLWRGTSKNNSVERDAANLEILRDQIAEMDNDLKNGLLTPELHEQGKRELQARLLEEVGDTQGAEVSNKPHPLKITAIVLAVLLPLASVGLYYKIGNLDAFSPMVVQGGASSMMGIARTDAEFSALAQKVESDPADGESLVMLARSYMEAGRYTDAARTYDKLTALAAEEAWVWADYADALAMAQGQTMRGKPTELLNKALSLDPNSLKGLALAGSAAIERGDYAATITYWGKLRGLVPDDSEDAKMLDSGLKEARQMMSHIKGGKAPKQLDQINSPAVAGGQERISGTVTLDAALKGKFSPDDTVFILARAVEGPKMPLAILRKQVRDLPLSFELDDSMAMTPQGRLSNFDQVVVVVRVSKSGDAMPKPGDGQGMSGAIKPGRKNVAVKIDQLVK
ncbi:MAG: c-type cytochrome biogenesis protein CcmI [Sideroxydans sp.]|nr:c-type cytochrome biogenesis protein CcmI [Sideroxydans sp.]